MAMITIGRQFGSGGHKIGEFLANRLGIPYYDDELILLTASELLTNEEGTTNPLFDRGSCSVREVQRATILAIAGKGPAVIVGRCADDILKKAGVPTLSVFIAAPWEQRVGRTMRVQGLSREAVEDLTRRKDESRRAFYKEITGREWGVPETYDLYYDTSESDIGSIIVDIVKHYNELRKETSKEGTK